MRVAVISVMLVLSTASPAAAQYAPEPEAPPARRAEPASDDRFWETAPPNEGSAAKAPLMISGAVAGGLGVIAVIASGIAALLATTHAAALDSSCQGRYCVRGTDGGDHYEAVGELLDASGILLGVGVPLTVAGLSLTIIGASLRGDYDGPRIAISPAGAEFEVRF